MKRWNSRDSSFPASVTRRRSSGPSPSLSVFAPQHHRALMGEPERVRDPQRFVVGAGYHEPFPGAA